MYNRRLAIKYAEEHVHNFKPQYPDYDSQAGKNTDCANFASQCLHEGGFPFNYGGTYSDWWCDYRKGAKPYGKGKAWAGANSLYIALVNNRIPNIKSEKLSSAYGLYPGDLIFSINPKNKHATHVMVVGEVYKGTPDVKIYQRGCKIDQRITRKTFNKNMSFIHITVDTNAPTPGPTTGWQNRYGKETLKKSNTYNAYAKNMQEDLMSIGFNVGSSGADGFYGPATVSAVKSFQSRYGLTSDGIFGKQSKEKLYNLIYANGRSEVDEIESFELATSENQKGKLNCEQTLELKVLTIVPQGCAVNIRNGNGTEFEKIGDLSETSQFKHVATAKNGWHSFVYKGQVAWVSGNYSTVE